MAKQQSHDWFNVYYSQNKEDLILKAFFPTIQDGFYVDVGAHDPKLFSVTKRFYDDGWSGINIEPQEKFYNQLVKARPRDINLQIALSASDGTLEFREYRAATGLSTLSQSMKETYPSDETFKNVTANYREYPVQTRTLSSVLNQYAKGKTIHFLKIDVEGFEKEVIAGNDWTVYRPLILCIESNHIVDDWRAPLKEYKYKEIFFDGLNRYYAPAEKYDELLRTFDYARTVLSKIPVSAVPFEMFDKVIRRQDREIHKLYKIIEAQNQHIKQQEARYPRSRLMDELGRMKNKILKPASVKGRAVKRKKQQ